MLSEPMALRSGVVFSSPHSGRRYFESFVESSRLDRLRLRSSEDAYVDELFAPAVEFGAPLLSAIAPRAFVDLNRSAADLDPALIDGAEGRSSSARVIAGLGVIPRIVAEGVTIYEDRLTLSEAIERIRLWHEPYHRALADLLVRARRRFGQSILIDCHSMPSAVAGVRGARRGSSADIVLGDRFGMSSEAWIVNRIEAAFQDEGFRVARNAPFAGGYITERYGRPASGVSAVQIEIDRALYLDPSSIEPNDRFLETAAALRRVITSLCELIEDESAAPLAAE